MGSLEVHKEYKSPGVSPMTYSDPWSSIQIPLSLSQLFQTESGRPTAFSKTSTYQKEKQFNQALEEYLISKTEATKLGLQTEQTQ